MAGSFSNVQSLHERGIVRICKDTGNRKHILTCGTDGSIVKWTEDALYGKSQSDVFTLADMTSSCVAWKDNSICLGYTKTDFITNTDYKCVGKVDLDTLGKEELTSLVNFQLDVTCLDIHNNTVVSGASDYSLKKCSLNGASGSVPERVEIESEPIDIRVDPKGEFAAVSSIDGSVTILKLEPFEVVTTLKKVFPNFGIIDIVNPLVTMAWSENGDELYVPSLGYIKTFKRDSWSSGEDFKGTNMSCNFSVCCLSASGSHMAASTLDNKIFTWKIEDRKNGNMTEFSRKAPGKTVITSIVFSPFNNSDLIVADSNEGICVLNKAIEGAAVEEKMEEDDDDSLILNRTKKDFLEDDDDDATRMSTASGDLGAIKRRYNQDAIGTNALEDFGFTTKAEGSNHGTSSHGTSNGPPTDFGSYMTREVKVQVPAKPKPIPSTFVSGSTPEDLAHRYLKWNRFGMVRSFKSESAKTSSIEIEFHDASVHSEIVLDNFDTNYELADISLKAVALASREDPDKEKAHKRDEELNEEELKGTSELFVLHIDSWDVDSRRWKVTLPRGDGAEMVLASDTMVAVLTATRNVRIFTLTGTQRQIFTHTEPILTATIFNDRLAIASISSGAFYEEGNLVDPQFKHTVHEYIFEGRKWYRQPVTKVCSGVMTSYPLPVAPFTSLSWLSYTNKGNLVIMNSDYSVCLRSACGLWTPILDAAPLVRSRSDGIWPVSVVESIGGTGGQIRYIYCRGTNHPIVSLNTPLTITQWKLPLCNGTSEKTKLEEELILNEMEQSTAIEDEDMSHLEDLQKKHLATIIKMFALACKADKDSRAAELATMVSSAKGIQLICTYASKNKKFALAEKVAEIGRDGVASASARGASTRAAVESSMKPRSIGVRRSVAVAPSPISSPSVLQDTQEPSWVKEKLAEDEAQLVDDYDDQEPPSQATTIGDQSMVFPMERIGKNPFKRDLNTTTDSLDTSSISVFDQLERTPVDVARKRNRDEDSASRQPVKKQAKLTFGTTPKGKENTESAKAATPYSLWLGKNEGEIRKKFSGDDADFAKFCVQSFRNLSANEKKEWKQKCESV